MDNRVLTVIKILLLLAVLFIGYFMCVIPTLILIDHFVIPLDTIVLTVEFWSKVALYAGGILALWSFIRYMATRSGLRFLWVVFMLIGIAGVTAGLIGLDMIPVVTIRIRITVPAPVTPTPSPIQELITTLGGIYVN